MPDDHPAPTEPINWNRVDWNQVNEFLATSHSFLANELRSFLSQESHWRGNVVLPLRHECDRFIELSFTYRPGISNATPTRADLETVEAFLARTVDQMALGKLLRFDFTGTKRSVALELKPANYRHFYRAQPVS